MERACGVTPGRAHFWIGKQGAWRQAPYARGLSSPDPRKFHLTSGEETGHWEPLQRGSTRMIVDLFYATDGVTSR